MDIAHSIRGVSIRLTDERWSHIISTHNDMAEYYDDCLDVIERPDFVLRGDGRTLKAVKAYGRHRYLQVIYRELSREDGFVITAYFVRSFSRRSILWQR